MLVKSVNNSKKRTAVITCIIVVLVLAISAVLALFSTASAKLTDANVQAMETKLAQLASQKKAISTKLSNAKNNKAEATEYKYYLDQQINLATDELATIDALILELETQITQKNNEIETTTNAIAEQYENFKSVMRLTYEEGDASYLEIILGSEDFYDFLVRVERVSSLMDYCSTLMDELEVNKKALEKAKSTLEESKTSQESYQSELSAKKNELDKLQYENENYLNTLSKDINQYQQTYNSYAQAEKELDAQLEKYLQELQAKENASYVGGEFMWPVPISWKRISSGYGYRTLNGVREFHRGIDIPASKGTPIYAANDGKVATAVYHYSYGNYVLINHGGGMATLYAHASKLNCKAGDTVKKGDIIAYVGTTGHSTGNHIHFEVRKDGKHVSPLSYVVQP